MLEIQNKLTSFRQVSNILEFFMNSLTIESLIFLGANAKFFINVLIEKSFILDIDVNFFTKDLIDNSSIFRYGR
jgi:hypothetical protein